MGHSHAGNRGENHVSGCSPGTNRAKTALVFASVQHIERHCIEEGKYGSERKIYHHQADEGIEEEHRVPFSWKDHPRVAFCRAVVATEVVAVVDDHLGCSSCGCLRSTFIHWRRMY